MMIHMNKFFPLKALLCVVLALFCACTSHSAVAQVAAEQAGKPNIIFILADDLGFNQIGAYGDTPIKTPNLDQLVRRGVDQDALAQAMVTIGLTPEFAEQSAALAANQGLYNGFLAAGLIWGLLKKEEGTSIQVFFLTCIVIAGVFGAALPARRHDRVAHRCGGEDRDRARIWRARAYRLLFPR